MDELDGSAFKSRILEKIKPQKPSPWGLSIGLDHGLINRIFNEEKIPTAKHLLTISRALGVSVDWLLTGEEPAQEPPPPVAAYPPEIQHYIDMLVEVLMKGSQDEKDIIRGKVVEEYRKFKEIEGLRKDQKRGA